MSAVPIRDRRAERTAATRQEILDAAWEVVRVEGLGGLAMRDLGARVGMRAQSLYAYFPSKNAIFDAMFAEANRELVRRTIDVGTADDPVQTLRRQTQVFLNFCAEDPVRHQLLFQRAIPGFEPSPESYRVAVEGLALARATIRACGITSARAFDAWTAIVSGVAAQQNANEPGGSRWIRLADELTDMYLAHFQQRPKEKR